MLLISTIAFHIHLTFEKRKGLSSNNAQILDLRLLL